MGNAPFRAHAWWRDYYLRWGVRWYKTAFVLTAVWPVGSMIFGQPPSSVQGFQLIIIIGLMVVGGERNIRNANREERRRHAEE